MGVSGQHHAPAALLPPGKWPPVPIVQEAGWSPEPVWTKRLYEKIICPRRGPNPDRPARSQTLHWLSYPAHNLLYRYANKQKENVLRFQVLTANDDLYRDHLSLDAVYSWLWLRTRDFDRRLQYYTGSKIRTLQLTLWKVNEKIWCAFNTLQHALGPVCNRYIQICHAQSKGAWQTRVL
jgi:hypothetical protein